VGLEAPPAGGVGAVRREDLVQLVADALERAAERLRAKGHEAPWPEDLRAREVVRLLRERSRQFAAKPYMDGESG
jgi:hypothetical protein